MRDRRTLLYLLILAAFLLSMMTLVVYADSGFRTGARSSALYNPDTKTFLYLNNADEKLPMASTTKIMTALLAIETLDPYEIITVSSESVGIEGSSLYLDEGDELIFLCRTALNGADSFHNSNYSTFHREKI